MTETGDEPGNVEVDAAHEFGLANCSSAAGLVEV